MVNEDRLVDLSHLHPAAQQIARLPDAERLRYVAAGRRIGRPLAHPADKVEYARLLKDQGASYGEISTKTGIPKTSLHRYLQG